MPKASTDQCFRHSGLLSGAGKELPGLQDVALDLRCEGGEVGEFFLRAKEGAKEDFDVAPVKLVGKVEEVERQEAGPSGVAHGRADADVDDAMPPRLVLSLEAGFDGVDSIGGVLLVMG